MATISAVFSPSTYEPVSFSVSATSNSAVQTFSQNQIVAITATGAIQVAFGQSTMSATAATSASWYIAAGTVQTFDLGIVTSMNFYNPGASSVTVFILPLSRA